MLHPPAARGAWPMRLMAGLLLATLVWPVGQAPAATAAVAELERQVADLQRRAEGLEGKLKDSALARKTADQARMEAERRLAERGQEVERLRAELTALQAAQAATEQQLAASQQETQRLETALAEALASKQAIETRLGTLQSRLPTTDGGSLTPDEARTAAREAHAALLAARDNTGSRTQREAAAAIQGAEAELRVRQLRLATTLNAHSIYRVRPNDSLGLIAQRFYGNSGTWQRIFTANQHLLEDPNRLTPGMTLVIP